MTKHKDTVPAAPDTSATPPATETGAGTSTTDQAPAGDGSGQELFDAPSEPQPAAPARNPFIGLPGFDVEGASEEELDEHLRILEKKERIRKLTEGETTPQSAPALVAAIVEPAAAFVPPAPAAADPNDIRAVKDGIVRYFSPTTWALMGEGAYGWQQSVPTPADL